MSGKKEIFQISAGQKRPHADDMALVVSETFEKMGFMEAFAEDDSEISGDILCASVHIQALEKGVMYFLAPESLAWAIAENLYGPDDLSDELISDMMGELLNTICGKFVSMVIPEQSFSLSIPEHCPGVPASQGDMHSYSYNIDNQGLITLMLQAE